MDDDALVRLLFELGQLKKLPRTGWYRAGVDDPETVAEHSCRAAQIAYLLAVAEDHPNPARVCAMVVFHEIGEARISDLDRTAQRYLAKDTAEADAVRDQLEPVGQVGAPVLDLWVETDGQETPAARIAKDAERIEMALTAREYEAAGHAAAGAWVDSAEVDVATETGKRWMALLRGMGPSEWWRRCEDRDG